jgi:5-hydroxyisourate hydrolase
MKRAAISTHVLDVSLGRPAAGVPVSLFFGEERVGAGLTDQGGRIAELVPSLEAGPYRLVFELDGYFGQRDHLFTSVSIGLEVRQPEEHHHVPLLIAPHSFTSYRGS